MWRNLLQTQGENVLEHINFYWDWLLHNALDALWLPLALVCVYRSQRLKAVGFVLLCMLTMRLQIELVETTGFKTGFTGLWKWPLLFRGYCVYGAFTTLYLILSRLSPRTSGAIYLAATLSIFFMAFVVSSIVLII